MTNRRFTKHLIAAAAGLAVLVASSASFAGFTIAPFTLNQKSKIYTFNYPTFSGGTFSCAACYAPGAVYSSPTGTAQGGYFYAPTSVVGNGPAFFVAPRTALHQSPSFGYYFNPYMGAAHAPGITTSFGGHPYTPLSPATAVVGGANASAGPDFTVHPSQSGIKAVTAGHTFGPGGNYLGTVSNFTGTNATFALGSGAGPGTTTFTALPAYTSAGVVKFTQGTSHANGFGGTMDWLGSNTGYYLSKTSGGATSACTGPYDGSATACYYYIPFAFPIIAQPGGGDENHWADAVVVELRSVSALGNVHAILSGIATTAFTTFKATTGTATMSAPDASALTLHVNHGSDTRTAAGAGNITLVTGWLGHSLVGTDKSHWGGSTVSKFHFPTVPATPSLASPSLGALGGLMAIAAVYVIRKRGSSN
jgi:hypothetical protein